MSYLEHWSNANTVTWEDVASFYEPMVSFYGKSASIGDLVQEKRRFVERWPVRDYAAIPGRMIVGCREDGGECKVDAKFSFGRKIRLLSGRRKVLVPDADDRLLPRPAVDHLRSQPGTRSR